MIKKILTAEEVANILNVSKETVYRLSRRNEIPHFYMGRLLRFSETEIINWINGNKQTMV